MPTPLMLCLRQPPFLRPLLPLPLAVLAFVLIPPLRVLLHPFRLHLLLWYLLPLRPQLLVWPLLPWLPQELFRRLSYPQHLPLPACFSAR